MVCIGKQPRHFAKASPEEMQEKHPQADAPVIPLSPTPSPIKINESEVVKALRICFIEERWWPTTH